MSDRLNRLKAATRMAFFETDYEGFDYATSGGTVFLVALNGKPYAITATHVRQTFEWRRLCVTDEKHGREIAGLNAVSRATNLVGDAEGTDIGDISIIEFSDGIGADFFKNGIYPLDDDTTGRSETGDALIAYGLPKELSTIEDQTIKPVFAELGFEDADEGFLEIGLILALCLEIPGEVRVGDRPQLDGRRETRGVDVLFQHVPDEQT